LWSYNAQTIAAFNQGRADRQAYETWYAGLPKGSSEQQGAFYWARVHDSDRGKGLRCTSTGYTKGADPWMEGCEKAKAMLDRLDGNQYYRAGWNSL
jgi:hypothetical protein